MKISNDIIDKLQALKGINVDVAYRVFKENKLYLKRSGFSENLVALAIDRDLPQNDRGMDFKGLFEVKEVKVSFTKREGLMRNGGDTAISAYLKSEPNFFESNIWDKTRKILIICVDEDRTIVDIRFFDGEKYGNKMKSDYDKIRKFKNLCRKENEFLVFKTGRNSIMLKGNVVIDMSKSIFSDELSNNIANQYYYIKELFDSKFHSYQNKVKSPYDSITILMDRLSPSEIEKIKVLAESKLKESLGFDISAGKELSF